jgi:hypothetical protein
VPEIADAKPSKGFINLFEGFLFDHMKEPCCGTSNL